MHTLYSPIFIGFVSFAATNVDDIFVLTALYSQSTSTKRRKAYITVGQYLGMCVLILLSIIGAFGALILPKQCVGFLGIVPIYMAVKMFYSNTKKPHHRNVLTDPDTFKVMAIVIGNGADNISVYVPMFMQGNWFHKLIIVAIFLILTGVWCWIAHKVVHNPWIGQFIERYGQKVIPIVLVGLGGYIIIKSGSFDLLVKTIFQHN